MTARKSGIVDPWRTKQVVTTTPEETELAPDIPITQLYPTQFVGDRCGVTVWLLPTGTVEGRVARARTHLRTALARCLADPQVAAMPAAAAFIPAPPPQAYQVSVDPPLYVAGDAVAAATALARLFRAAGRVKHLSALFEDLGIRAYIT